MKRGSAAPIRLPRPLARLARRAARVAALAAIPALAPAELAAQPAPAELEVVRAALPHLRQSVPAGPAALDPEPFCRARLVGWDCPAEFREAAESLGFRLSGRAFTLVCIRGPSTCRLVGAGSLVLLAEPRLSGREATLDATLWMRTGEGPRPLDMRRLRLTLARGSGGWEVVGEERR